MTKRLLAAALAAILTLSLAACGENSSTPTQSANPQSANLPSTGSGGDSVLETDFQKNMHQSTSEWIYALCETEAGYYFEYDCFVYFMDKETGATTILCGKPDCAHNDESCNAYIYSPFLAYYNDKLYWSHDDYEQENGSVVHEGKRLHSMEVDGTNHSVVQQLESVPGGDTSNYVTNPIIHRGNIYFAYSGALYTVALGADMKDATLIYGEEQADDGSKVINPRELCYELWADGDAVYFMGKNVQQSDGTYKDTLFCYDTQTAEVTEVWKVPDKDDVGTWATTGVSVTQWYISGGYIYFYLSGNGIWYTELSTGDTTKLIDVEASAGVASFSDEYIVIMSKTVSGVNLINGSSALSGGDTLYIYDYKGKLVQEISLDKIYDDYDKVSECSLLWIDEGKVYIHADATIAGTYDGKTTTAATQDHAIYVAEIDFGSLEKTDWSFYMEF